MVKGLATAKFLCLDTMIWSTPQPYIPRMQKDNQWLNCECVFETFFFCNFHLLFVNAPALFYSKESLFLFATSSRRRRLWCKKEAKLRVICQVRLLLLGKQQIERKPKARSQYWWLSLFREPRWTDLEPKHIGGGGEILYLLWTTPYKQSLRAISQLELKMSTVESGNRSSGNHLLADCGIRWGAKRRWMDRKNCRDWWVSRQ
jgi:hypothetical protein